jgi:hydrogenase maturation protease
MARVLVAGIGNVFRGDDGFGVEVVRHLERQRLPDQVEVLDVGIRGLHLAYRLLEDYDLLVAVDLVARGGAPGTLYVIEPRLDDSIGRADAHSIDLPSVFAMVRTLGGELRRVVVVGCEPADLGEQMGLSPVVQAAIEPTIACIRQIAEGAIHETKSVAERV